MKEDELELDTLGDRKTALFVIISDTDEAHCNDLFQRNFNKYHTSGTISAKGVRPFLSDKFDITKHKNYKLLEDYDKRNVFDIEEYIKRKGKAKMNGNTVITRL
ncbi:hypothetical protein [Treponema denticola]|uniref:hypothetical protein n=1 Tax=Treponema denticola TaxID=158 RepID=UPI0020A43669|nr:hypothetical protein [Treponema denticola]UTC84385.1 hypothetical protein E4N91_01505 [Treponema denticola]